MLLKAAIYSGTVRKFAFYLLNTEQIQLIYDPAKANTLFYSSQPGFYACLDNGRKVQQHTKVV